MTLNIVLYAIGWLLYVAAQAQNSIKSKTNGLAGWSGIKLWLRSQTVNLLTRAFFSALAYGFVIHTVAVRVQSAGFPVTSTMIAGVGGYAANTMLYQLFGYFPWLRVEVSDLAPPCQTTNTPPELKPPGATQ